MKYKYIYVYLLIAIIFLSCKVQRNVDQITSSKNAEVYQIVSDNYLQFNTLLVKSSIFFDDGKKKINLKGNFKIRKDSIIILSLTPGLGIEVARIKLSKDSIFILDRLSSSYTKADYQFIDSTFKLKINFNDIQSILTNELFLYPRLTSHSIKDEFVSSFKIRSGKSTIDFYRKTDMMIENLISINKDNFFISNYIISDLSRMRNLKLSFEQSFSDEMSNLPKLITLISSFSNKYINIRIKYNKVTKDKSLNFSFRVPSKYKTITL